LSRPHAWLEHFDHTHQEIIDVNAEERIKWTINGKTNVLFVEEISLFSKFPKSKKRHFSKVEVLTKIAITRWKKSLSTSDLF
jgi:hypothetical protein